MRRGKRRIVRENPVELAPFLWIGGLVAGSAAIAGVVYASKQATASTTPAAPVPPLATYGTPEQQQALQAQGDSAPPPGASILTPGGFTTEPGDTTAPSAPSSGTPVAPTTVNGQPQCPPNTYPDPTSGQCLPIQAPPAGTVPPGGAPTSSTAQPAGLPHYVPAHPEPAKPTSALPFSPSNPGNTSGLLPTASPATAPAATPSATPPSTSLPAGVSTVAPGGACPPGYTRNGFTCTAPNAPNGGCPPGTVPWQGKCQPPNGGPCPPGTVAWQGGCEVP
jgi:hypothetical protein